MNKLIVIDMQNDFVTGSLANKDAERIIPFIKAQIEHFQSVGAQVIFTRDTHNQNYLSTNEGKHLPVEHCIKGTKGWEIVPELNGTPNAIVIDKVHFGYPTEAWNHYIEPGDEVWICGTCTDICVVSNALAIKGIEGVEVKVLAEGCAGLSKEKHEHALDVMESCQCEIIRNLADYVKNENVAQETGA